jgi:PmbA protein
MQNTLENLPGQIVARGTKAGASDVIGQVEIERRRMVRFSNNSITVVKSWNVVSPMVHLGFGKRGIASRVSDTSIETIDRTVSQMIRAAKALPETEFESHLPKGPFRYAQIADSFDPKVSVLEGELIDAVEAAINAALQAGAKRVSGVLSSYETRKMLRTSAGAEASTEQSMIEIIVRSFADDDASGQGVSVSTGLKDFRPEEAGTASGSLAKAALNPATVDEGKYNVVFGPSIFANLLNRVAFSASAYAVEGGLSFLADKVGEKVASEQFTLIDDRLRANSPGAVPFDDEGYPTQTNPLIQKGVLKTFVHDSRTAAKFKAPLTGNAVWVSEAGQIIPFPTCMIVEPGSLTREQLFEEAGDGLYVTNNWYTRFQNFRTGDFSTIPRDAIFKIKNGRLSEPVKGIRISDNMLRILRSIRVVSQERKWLRWWEVDIPTYLGHFLVDDVGITKSRK